MDLLIRGVLSVKDMDAEELARMQFRDKNGKFTGRPNVLVPRDLALEARKELLKRGEELFAMNFINAIKVMMEIAMSGEHDGDRLKAAQYVIERIAGKMPDKVEVTGDAPWQIFIQNIVNDVAETQKPKVVRGEVVSRDE